jgi:hypothetical protein
MFLLNRAAVVWLLGIDTPTKKNSYQVPNHEVFQNWSCYANMYEKRVSIDYAIRKVYVTTAIKKRINVHKFSSKFIDMLCRE